MVTKFGFEDLEVWKRGINFAKIVISLADELNQWRKHFKIAAQLESAAVSVPSNIAEGTGRFSRKEFINFLYIARGSLYETVTLLTICRDSDWIRKEDFERLKFQASEINRMISGLVNFLKRSSSCKL